MKGLLSSSLTRAFLSPARLLYSKFCGRGLRSLSAPCYDATRRRGLSAFVSLLAWPPPKGWRCWRKWILEGKGKTFAVKTTSNHKLDLFNVRASLEINHQVAPFFFPMMHYTCKLSSRSVFCFSAQRRHTSANLWANLSAAWFWAQKRLLWRIHPSHVSRIRLMIRSRHLVHRTEQPFFTWRRSRRRQLELASQRTYVCCFKLSCQENMGGSSR